MMVDRTKQLLGHYSSLYSYSEIMGFDRRLSLAQVRRHWRAFLRSSPFGREVGLHVHIPYCRRRCTYCDCSSQPLGSRTRLDAHLERLRAEMRYLRDDFRAVHMRRLYVGGGTPNLLSPAQLQCLAADVDACFRLRPGAVRSIEFAPELTSAMKLEAARAGGFDRISFGVQSLNPRVLAAVQRDRMSATRAERAVRGGHAAGFAEINVDLIFGLAGERTCSFHRGLREVARWGPHTVTVQLLANSELGSAYRSRGHERAVARRFAGYAEQLEARLDVELPGYRLALRPRTLVLVHESLLRPWESWLDFYSGQDRVSVSTLGLGTFAQSRMHTAWHLQNMDHLADFDPEARHYQGRRFTPELEATIDATAALMIEGRCDLAALRHRYGPAVEPLEQVVNRLVARGQLGRSGAFLSAGGGRKNPLLPLLRDLSQASAANDRDGRGPVTDPRLAIQGRLAEAPEGQAPGQRAALKVNFRAGGSRWFVQVEPATDDRRYYKVVGGVGIFYGSHGPWSDETEHPLGQLMENLARRLAAARYSAGDVTDHAPQVRSLVVTELEARGWSTEG